MAPAGYRRPFMWEKALTLIAAGVKDGSLSAEVLVRGFLQSRGRTSLWLEVLVVYVALREHLVVESD